MEVVKEYLVSVTCAALLCGILRSCAGQKGTGGAVISLLCGVFMTLTVIRPVGSLVLPDIARYAQDVTREANTAAQTGADYTRQARERIIKEQTCAYILEKALSYGAELEAEVTALDPETGAPTQVRLSGPCSPYARSQIAKMIAEELGIIRENQLWRD